MKHIVTIYLIFLFVVFYSTGLHAEGEKIVHVSEHKHFKIGYECHQDAMAPKEYHTAKLAVQILDGKPVSDAKINIEYIMPKQGGHHMPRRPKVSEHLGNGRYDVESVNFQIPGTWKIIVLVEADGVEVKAEFEIMVAAAGHDMNEMQH